VPESVKDLLRLSRGALEMFQTTQWQLLDRLQKQPLLAKRVTVLRSIRGVGEVLALTWALEVGDPQRFPSVGDAVSYCGLTSALDSSADKQKRGPISKQRNAHLPTVLVEAAKVAPVEPAIGSGPRAGGPARTPQSGDPGGGTQTGGLSVSRGQIRKTIPNPHSCGNRRAACTGGGGGVRNPNPGFTVGPPFPAQ